MTGVYLCRVKLAVEGRGEVSAILEVPGPGARALLVLAHGAGAGMQHPFMAGLAAALGERGVATLRYQFLYSERGSKRTDPEEACVAVVRAAVVAASAFAGPVFAGGKSFGGRMTAYAQARAPLPGVRGLVFYGYPLHPPGDPGKAARRAQALHAVALPMLFLQGDRDAFAPASSLEPVLARLPTAQLHSVGGGDHGFAVRGKRAAEVLAELAAATCAFIDGVLR
jgi:predicted alpha/beta-hydrolase family hydrolase